MPIDLHVWSGVHSHSRRLARAPGPGRGGSRRRAAGDRIAAGRQPRWRSRAAHAKDRRRRSAYTGIANWSYRRWYIPPLRASPKTATKVSCGYSIGFVALGVGVCSQCTTGYAAQARCFPRARGPAGNSVRCRSAFPSPNLQPEKLRRFVTRPTGRAMSTAMDGDGLSEVRSPSPMFRASKSVLHARAPPEGSLLRRLSSGSSVPGNGSLHSAGMDATEPGPRWFSWAAAVLTAPWSVDGTGPLEDALPSL